MQTAPLLVRIHVSTTLALICVATGLALLPSLFPITAALFGIGAYFLAMKEVSTYTSRYQFLMVYCSAMITGLVCDWPLAAFPYFTLACMLAATGSVGRMIFFRVLGYTGYTFLEPVFLLLSATAWLGANLLHPSGWIGWAIPLPLLIFQGILAFGILKDKLQLLSFTKGGYKIAIGAEAPDFSLPDQDGHATSLSSFRGQRHLLLVFVRGDWCPGCHMMLRTYQKEAARFRTKNIFAMAIGPDPVGVNREMVEKLGLDFKVLSDERQRTAVVYGVQLDKYDNDFAEKYEEGIPLPASFLIDKNGIVRYVSRPDKVGEFLDPRTIFPIIDRLA
jgi:peroxiredoxin